MTEHLHNPDLTFKPSGERLMRRVQGYHDLRLDGIGDLLHRARGASVLDIGCNRGLAGFEFAYNGASRVMGLDNYEDGIVAARHIFCDLRAVEHRFEVVDLTGGPDAIRKAFGKDSELRHDIVLMLATYHKLARIMTPKALAELMMYFGNRTLKYFGWRGYAEEIPTLDGVLGRTGLQRIHTSLISDIQPAAIWARK
jgi:SAM-dependent methyltransferase